MSICNNPACASEFVPKPNTRGLYCSRSCSATVTNSTHPKRLKAQKTCSRCNGVLRKPWQKKFCSRDCFNLSITEDRVGQWLEGGWDGSTSNGSLARPIRNHLLAQAGYACTECGWSKPNPVTGLPILTIDHVNGKASDNRPENLKVLCYNCHSLTPTFGALNMGNGTRYKTPGQLALEVSRRGGDRTPA